LASPLVLPVAPLDLPGRSVIDQPLLLRKVLKVDELLPLLFLPSLQLQLVEFLVSLGTLLKVLHEGFDPGVPAIALDAVVQEASVAFPVHELLDGAPLRSLLLRGHRHVEVRMKLPLEFTLLDVHLGALVALLVVVGEARLSGRHGLFIRLVAG